MLIHGGDINTNETNDWQKSHFGKNRALPPLGFITPLVRRLGSSKIKLQSVNELEPLGKLRF